MGQSDRKNSSIIIGEKNTQQAKQTSVLAEKESDEAYDAGCGSVSYEKETIINYNNAEKEAVYYTLNRYNIEMIRRLAEKYPNEVHIISQGDSAIEATLPKSWVKIRPPRQLTDEQREALVQRGRELYARMAAQNPQ